MSGPPRPAVPSALALALDRNDAPLRALLDAQSTAAGVRAAVFGRCWPDDPPRRSAVNLDLQAGESLEAARVRLGLRWNPAWLVEAGFMPWDAAGTSLDAGAHSSAAGPMSWTPEPALPRVDDGAPVTPVTTRAADRLREHHIVAGEVAVLALWARDAAAGGLTVSDIDLGLTARGSSAAGQARGARFNGAIAYYLERALPGWRIETQVNIRDVFGLHLRSDVVRRAADVVIISPAGKIMAFLSAKFSWRSDRGTEAAQMVFLQRYRPDLPYVLMTAEFPRALGDLANESIEDQVFHLCGDWVGSWRVTQDLPNAGDALPTLGQLAAAGSDRVPGDQLVGFDAVVQALKTAARYL